MIINSIHILNLLFMLFSFSNGSFWWVIWTRFD